MKRMTRVVIMVAMMVAVVANADQKKARQKSQGCEWRCTETGWVLHKDDKRQTAKTDKKTDSGNLYELLQNIIPECPTPPPQPMTPCEISSPK